jgi:cell division septal protein FtsQ
VGIESFFDPFKKKRRKKRSGNKKRRRKSWKKRKWGASYFWIVFFFLIGLPLISLLLKKGINELEASPWFGLQQVKVMGQQVVPEKDLLGLLQIPRDVTLGELNLDEMKERVLTHPWVQDVSLHKGYPDQLRVEVVERRPTIALKGWGNQWFLVDAEGIILEKTVSPVSLLPRFLPRTSQNWAVGEQIQDPGFAPGLRLARELKVNYGYGDEIKIEIGEAQNMVLQVEGYRVHFGEDPFQKKLKKFLDIREDLGHRKIKKGEIDLRFSDKVVVKHSKRGM